MSSKEAKAVTAFTPLTLAEEPDTTAVINMRFTIMKEEPMRKPTARGVR